MHKHKVALISPSRKVRVQEIDCDILAKFLVDTKESCPAMALFLDGMPIFNGSFDDGEIEELQKVAFPEVRFPL